MFEQFTPNLWVQRSAWFDINVGIFVSQNHALLIDPGISADEVDAMHQFALKLSLIHI